ncbi:hypothetical protein [Spiroplasma tabanidicola]|uniref:Uncharacterized protein n=1 Tax=Spiroplasma tabanidicola TaxID=324079 RepID=A0A6I6CEM0_9MOLU|nr:hypothetical protein [Spiroplasma tabanidicola]QGS52424.1 hypothetical protein STABA_v1c10770 [Spiroplasma tabanidicola]
MKKLDKWNDEINKRNEETNKKQKEVGKESLILLEKWDYIEQELRSIAHDINMKIKRFLDSDNQDRDFDA